MSRVLRLRDDTQIIKSNQIIEARYKLSLLEQKLILIMASLINRRDDDFKFYKISFNDLVKALGIEKDKKRGYHNKVKEIIANLNSKPIFIQKGERWISFSWIASAEYIPEEAMIEFEFSQKLKPYLLQLKRAFTTYKLKNVIRLKSSYSIRIYELLKQYEKIGSRTIPLDELKKKLGVEQKYKKYNDFKRFVLTVAKSELPKKSDIDFDYREIRHGKQIAEIEFYNIRHNVPVDYETGQITFDFHFESQESKSHETVDELPAGAYDKELAKRGVSQEQISELVEKFSDINRMWQDDSYPIINFYCQYFDWAREHETKKPKSGAWLYKAIKGEWEPPIRFKTRQQIKREHEQETAKKQALLDQEAKQKQAQQRKDYEEWLTLSPEEKWFSYLFQYRTDYRKKHSRPPTPKQEASAKAKYLKKPESPEEYQKRIFGKVKFPTTSKSR